MGDGVVFRGVASSLNSSSLLRRGEIKPLAHFRDLAPGNHNSEEASQRWQILATRSDLTGPGIESQTCHVDSDAYYHYAKRPT